MTAEFPRILADKPLSYWIGAFLLPFDRILSGNISWEDGIWKNPERREEVWSYE